MPDSGPTMSAPPVSQSPPPAGPSRRTLLVAGGSVIVGAAVGVTFGLNGREEMAAPTPQAIRRDRAAIRQIQAAIAAERVLVDRAGTARRTVSGTLRARVDDVHADHIAHLDALEGVLARLRFPAGRAVAASGSVSGSASGSVARESAPVPAGSFSVADLRRAEVKASSAAAARAAALSGPAAVLLATIAASEACHAEALA